MKLRWLAVLLMGVAVHAVCAQEVAGTWQGTLPSGEYPRAQVVITKSGNGDLHGLFSQVDRGPARIPASSTAFHAPDLVMEESLLGIRFEGKMSADGQSIAGVWTQDKKHLPVTLARATAETAWRYQGPQALTPMAVTANPAFEVATVKLSAPDARGRSINTRTRKFEAKNVTLEGLIEFAYQLRERQVQGGPAWMKEARFDLVGEPDAEGLPSQDQVRVMLKKLLAERFAFRVHTVQKVFPVYALSVEKSPAKVTPSDPAGNGRMGILTKEGADGQLQVRFIYSTMPEFAAALMNFIPERQIVDHTGLTGMFDFALSVPMLAVQGGAGMDENERVTAFFDAARQVGLVLKPSNEALEVLVIDRVEKPSAN